MKFLAIDARKNAVDINSHMKGFVDMINLEIEADWAPPKLSLLLKGLRQAIDANMTTNINSHKNGSNLRNGKTFCGPYNGQAIETSKWPIL